MFQQGQGSTNVAHHKSIVPIVWAHALWGPRSLLSITLHSVARKHSKAA
jgi:hypothetical protein